MLAGTYQFFKDLKKQISNQENTRETKFVLADFFGQKIFLRYGAPGVSSLIEHCK